MGLPQIKKPPRRVDRVTAGLALLATSTVASVLGWAYLRQLYHRLAQRQVDPELEETTANAVLAAGQATQDTVRVAVEGYSLASRPETVLLHLFGGFVSSFALARLSTLGMRSGWWPLGTVSVGGRHIHHFIPGILLTFGTGIAALISQDQDLQTKLAIPFGVGLGLTFDEAALLLELEDVYWTEEGVLSVQISLATISVIGVVITAVRILNRGERHAEELGWVPTAEGEILAP